MDCPTLRVCTRGVGVCFFFFFFIIIFFFFNDTATTEIYTLSLHDALPIWRWAPNVRVACSG